MIRTSDHCFWHIFDAEDNVALYLTLNKTLWFFSWTSLKWWDMLIKTLGIWTPYFQKVKAIPIKSKEKHNHIFQKKLRHSHGQWVPRAGDVCSTHTFLNCTSQSFIMVHTRSHQWQPVTTERIKGRKLGGKVEPETVRPSGCCLFRSNEAHSLVGHSSDGNPRRRLSINSSVTIGEWAWSLLESVAPTSLI